jgi:hypothetical protein
MEESRSKIKFVSLQEMMRIDPNYKPREGPPKRPSLGQIQALLDSMQEIQSVAKESSAIVTEQLRLLFLRRMLERDFVLENSEVVYETYKARQDRLFQTASCKDGTMLGQLAASAESCATTQATLKTKKSVSSSASILLQGALPHLTSLLHAQEQPKDMNMSVHFRYKVTKRQVIDLTETFVSVTLRDLIDKERTTIALLSTKYELDKDDDNLPFNVCYDVYRGTNPSQRQPNHKPYYLRIAFDKSKLYAHQLTPYKIASIIREHKLLAQFWRIIPSGFSDAFIDIYSTSRDTTIEAQKTDLYYNVYESLKAIILQGIPEIEALAPGYVSYHTLFKDIRKLQRWDRLTEEQTQTYFSEKERPHVLEYDLMTMANHNYPSYRMIEDSLEKAGVKILDRLYKKYTNRLYGYIIEFPIMMNAAVLNSRLQKLEEESWYSVEDNIIILNLEEGRYTEETITALAGKLDSAGFDWEYLEENDTVVGYQIKPVEVTLEQALKSLDPIDSEYVYAVLKGSNMEKIMQHPWVDTSRIATNSIPIMQRYFGIEVARSYFIYDYIANKNAVDAISQSRYTFIIADDMTYWGEPFGISFHGNAKKKDSDFVKLSTFSRPQAVFARAAAQRQTALVTSISASILTSGEIFAGTNAPTVLHPSVDKMRARIEAIKGKTALMSVSNQVNKRLAKPLTLEELELAQSQSIRDTISPTILPEKIPKLVIGEGVARESKPYYTSFVTPVALKDVLEDTSIVMRVAQLDEKISGSIVTKTECLELLSIKRKQMTYDAIKALAPASDAYVEIYRDYLVPRVDEDTEFEEVEPFVETNRRFIPDPNSTVSSSLI